jgi:hypothetical protein
MDKVLRILLRMEGASALRRSIRTARRAKPIFTTGMWMRSPSADRVRSGESRRLFQSTNRRFVKSICISVTHVAWLLDHDRNATVCGGLPQPALGRFGRVFTSSPGRSRALGPAIGALVMIAGTRYYFERSTRLASLSAIKLKARHAVAKVMRYGILRSLSG